VQKLEEFRQADPAYKGSSFGTIAGSGPNGAVIHYRPSQDTNRVLDQDSLLLIDSGGQYLDENEGIAGTTDITRTVAIGDPSDEMRLNFTRVLKGHIAVARARFPAGTTGVQVDALARQPLWDSGLDYAHGTGHGVGVYLCVHEEAASISPRGREAFQVGMLISNEPGYYKEGAYGIRIESLVSVQEGEVCESSELPMMRFETVTFAPLARKLIDVELLDREEKAWLNLYFKRLQDLLAPLLEKDVRGWLVAQTSAF
jgi:Xaa-Pro aminopeptidase